MVKVNAPEVAAGRAVQAALGPRARRDGHQHRPVPVGRGPLQADARHLGGAARHTDAGLDPDQVASAATRPRADEAGGGPRQHVDPHARGEGLAGHRTAYPAPQGAYRGGGRAQPVRHSLRGPDRAADPRRQRRSQAGRGAARTVRRGRGGDRRRHRPAPARGGQGPLVRVAGRAPAGPRAALPQALPQRRLRDQGRARASGSAGPASRAAHDAANGRAVSRRRRRGKACRPASSRRPRTPPSRPRARSPPGSRGRRGRACPRSPRRAGAGARGSG